MQSEMDFWKITEQYYSNWTGVDIETVSDGEIRSVYNTERNLVPFGYNKPFDLYVFRLSHKIIVSYGDKAADSVAVFARKLDIDASQQDISALIHTIFGQKPRENLKFVYTRPPEETAGAIALRRCDFERFYEFTLRVHPQIKDSGEDRAWLRDYFLRNVDLGCFCAVAHDGYLVSCSDAPYMPYMESLVQEIGINTLEEYRRRGYATQVCRLAAHNIIQAGKCPLWSTSASNRASEALAYRCGFEKYADVYGVSL